MEQIRELTKRLIANSFKELLLQTPFEKITIKMITDHANVIRPTFYNHFHDKYELIEWIVRDEIFDKVNELEQEDRLEDGIKYIFSRFYEDREFYKRAFEIEGQNGFVETVTSLMTENCCEMLKKNNGISKNLKVSVELVGRYYSSGLIAMLQFLVEGGDRYKYEDFLETYNILSTKSIYEFKKDI